MEWKLGLYKDVKGYPRFLDDYQGHAEVYLKYPPLRLCKETRNTLLVIIQASTQARYGRTLPQIPRLHQWKLTCLL